MHDPKPTAGDMPDDKPKGGAIRRFLGWFFSYRSPWMWGVIAIAAFAVGIVFWGGFNWAMEATNQEAFCISCHEMKDNVFAEYRKTVHYSNRTGVRASCPDCHVPKEWGHKVVRRIQASNELLHKALGALALEAGQRSCEQLDPLVGDVQHMVHDVVEELAIVGNE